MLWILQIDTSFFSWWRCHFKDHSAIDVGQWHQEVKKKQLMLIVGLPNAKWQSSDAWQQWIVLKSSCFQVMNIFLIQRPNPVSSSPGAWSMQLGVSQLGVSWERNLLFSLWQNAARTIEIMHQKWNTLHLNECKEHWQLQTSLAHYATGRKVPRSCALDRGCPKNKLPRVLNSGCQLAKFMLRILHRFWQRFTIGF